MPRLFYIAFFLCLFTQLAQASIHYDREKARKGNHVELDKWNKNELNSIDKENIVRENYDCKERPYNYFANEEY